MTSTKRPGIREAYTAMGLTRRMFAERVDLDPQTVTNIVCGYTGMSDATVNRIAAVLGWSRHEVLRGERIIEREPERESEHVSPTPLDPARPADEPTRPPNKPDSASAA